MKTKQQNLYLYTSMALFAIFFMLALLVIFNNNWLIITDTNIASFFANNRQPFFDYAFVIASYIGKTVVIAVLCLLLLLLPNRKNLGIPVVIITVASALLNFLLKIIIARARPDGYFLTTNVLGYKMPTGYSVAIALCLSICFARIYLAVHFLSDVLAGASLGLSIVFLGAFVAQHIKPKALNIY